MAERSRLHLGIDVVCDERGKLVVQGVQKESVAGRSGKVQIGDMLLWIQTERKVQTGKIETRDLKASELSELLANGPSSTVDLLRIFFFRPGCKEEVVLEVDVRAKTCRNAEVRSETKRLQGHEFLFEHLNAQKVLTSLMKPAMKKPTSLIANTSENWELWEGPDDAQDTEIECLLDDSAQPASLSAYEESRINAWVATAMGVSWRFRAVIAGIALMVSCCIAMHFLYLYLEHTAH